MKQYPSWDGVNPPRAKSGAGAKSRIRMRAEYHFGLRLLVTAQLIILPTAGHKDGRSGKVAGSYCHKKN